MFPRLRTCASHDPPRPSQRRETTARGFTLIELMITLTVLAVVMIVLAAVMNEASRSKTATSNNIESVQAARGALDLISRDLRSAGYGADLYWLASPQPPIAYVDSMQVLINANFSPWPDDTVPKPPLAYNPVGFPRPFPLNGTSWEPPIKYRRGAEIVRWTLDVNDDGQVNAGDVASVNGVDAQRTPNPNDYVLVRQVYGDSTANVANWNGGQMERIALVRRPGGGVPPMFRVYLEGQDQPWNWSSGPLPAAKLSEIERIEVEIVAASSRPNKGGDYPETRLTTDVNSIRNVPGFGRKEYPVDGFVYNDLDTDYTKDPLEPGLGGATVRLGKYSSVTNASGYYILRVPAGTYTLRHVPPPGYGVFTSPDSVSITVGPAATFSFADTARAGGWVTGFVYEDKNQSGSHDDGEPPMLNLKLTMSPTGEEQFTNASGIATLFAPVGPYGVTVTPPDSFVCTTPNPVSGIMTNPGAASHQFGLGSTAVGQVRGKVFRDNDRDGILDAGESGLSDVWVGVSTDGGVTVLSYQYTDASGNYALVVPANDPPTTTPYSIMAIVPPGYYATGTTVLGPVWVAPGSVLLGKNFGMLGYQVIKLNASRVLSLESGDIVEKLGPDNGGIGARRDADIVLGADAGGTDNISIWFNDYDNTPVFQANPTYTRNAPHSVLSLSLDTLDSVSPTARLDAVTGTKNALAGNFFVWFNQSTGGNEGYFPLSFSQAYRTKDNGDVQVVLTRDVAGGLGSDQPDIIVGTKSPTANQGTIEIWQSDNAKTPTYSQLEVYPPAGAIPTATIGQVNAMALADFNGDGLEDLVVGTKTGDLAGGLLFLRQLPKGVLGPGRFVFEAGYTIAGTVTSLVPVKVDFDGLVDVVVGVQTGSNDGELQQWTNATSAVLSFKHEHTVGAPGIVLALATADFGGLAGQGDLAMGWRQDETSYVGGLRIYPLDAGKITSSNSDPSAGSITNMVPALTVDNFNFGVKPTTPLPPYLLDLAAGVKVSATTGALVVFIR